MIGKVKFALFFAHSGHSGARLAELSSFEEMRDDPLELSLPVPI
jgi:hypothetical protein